MKSRDSFSPPTGTRKYSRVKRMDVHLKVLETDYPEVPEVPAVPEELDDEGAVITEAVAAVPAVPAYSEITLSGDYEYHRPTEDGGSPDYCKGDWRDQLSSARRGQIRKALEESFAKINGDA